MTTLKDIARLAGVSAKTAERALSGETKDIRRDARERAQRVREIADAYGYRPSELALALRRGRVQTIGFIADILTDQFLSAAVETSMDEAAKKQYKIAVQVVRFDPKQTLDAIKTFLASGMDGIISTCNAEQLPPKLMHTLERQKYPLFTLAGQSGYDFSSTNPDYSESLPQAIRHLKERGHKRITFSLFSGKPVDNARNGKLFLEYCKQYGIEPDLRIHTELHQAELLADQKLPAVILYGKYSMRVYQDRCRHLNIHPDVIGIYNEWTLASSQNFPLQGIILEQAEESVRSAIRQVLDQINGGAVRHLSLPTRFISKREMQSLKVPNLTNQRLFDYQ